MSISKSIEPITGADNETIRRAVEQAHLPSLLAALAHATGDLSLLREDLVPDTSFAGRAMGGFTPEQREKALELAYGALIRFRDSGGRPASVSEQDLRKLIDYLAGGQTSDEYVPLLEEELAFPAEDARAPRWRKEEVAPGIDFSVAIIGAGMSGLLAGIRLKQAGVPFTIIEKNSDVGGTWWENTYPGARVDNSNHMYSYSFAQRVDWPYHFSTQRVLHEYFSDVADEYGMRPHIRFNTEAQSLTYNDDRATWTLRLKTKDGREETMEANAVVCAVGQLNRPKLPQIKGIGTFEGPAFHSARWDHSVDLKGKRVAVIGNGASASQFIPEIAPDVAELLVFQRTPTWYASVPNYHAPVEEGLQWLFRHVPGYHQWYRFWLFWTSAEGLLPSARVDDGWDGNPASIGKANDELRAMMTAYLKEQFADRPDLWDAVIPKYPPASKRIVLDNGIWAATLKRENVKVITTPIEEITPRGVRTTDGVEQAVDVLIYGTGFQASKFLTPMTVVGKGGIDLNEQWDGDARAYLGITVPNFPNLFLMYGPNTNIVVNGSIVYFSECETNYILGSIRMLLEGKHRAMDVRKDVHDEFNVRVDRENLRMAWGVAEVPSWYRNERGRSAQNWPFTLLEYWQRTREPNPADYELV